jgi:hypothetical protein
MNTGAAPTVPTSIGTANPSGWLAAIADLTRRSGHYNLSLGAVAMAGGMGATVSKFVSGFIPHAFGFLLLACVTIDALFGCGFPRPWRRHEPRTRDPHEAWYYLPSKAHRNEYLGTHRIPVDR